MKKLLSISVVIPAYNEQRNLTRLFNSLKNQTYPKSKIEYILVDDDSSDRSIAIAKKFGAKIVRVKTHDIELNKGIGMHKAKNDLVYWLDADMQICGKDFFEKLAEPLNSDNSIDASFTAEFAMNKKLPYVKSSILRFISYHPLQQDPLYAFFSPDLQNQIVHTTSEYFVCKFVPGRIPAVGRILYRRKKLLSTEVGKHPEFIDMEAVETYTRAGFDTYAYVPKALIRHYHAETLGLLVKKRLRNLDRDYLPNYENKHFTWFDIENKKDILKIIFWVIWANAFIPETIRGLYYAVKHRDHAFLWQPVVAIVTTDAILLGFMSHRKGRQIIARFLRNIIR